MLTKQWLCFCLYFHVCLSQKNQTTKSMPKTPNSQGEKPMIWKRRGVTAVFCNHLAILKCRPSFPYWDSKNMQCLKKLFQTPWKRFDYTIRYQYRVMEAEFVSKADFFWLAQHAVFIAKWLDQHGVNGRSLSNDTIIGAQYIRPEIRRYDSL